MLRRISLSHYLRGCHSSDTSRAVNMHILKSLLIAVVLIKSASLQQQLVCMHCNDCYSIDRNLWSARSCHDDSPPPGGQTTPGLPIMQQYQTQNGTNELVPLVQPANNNFQCFTITQESEFELFLGCFWDFKYFHHHDQLVDVIKPTVDAHRDQATTQRPVDS
jgi:hypothetical protein